MHAFLDAFLPNAAATVLGVLAGAQLALWTNRMLERRATQGERRRQAQLANELLCLLLEAAVRNWDALRCARFALRSSDTARLPETFDVDTVPLVLPMLSGLPPAAKLAPYAIEAHVEVVMFEAALKSDSKAAREYLAARVQDHLGTLAARCLDALRLNATVYQTPAKLRGQRLDGIEKHLRRDPSDMLREFGWSESVRRLRPEVAVAFQFLIEQSGRHEPVADPRNT